MARSVDFMQNDIEPSTGPSLGYSGGSNLLGMHSIGYALSLSMGQTYSDFRRDNFTVNEQKYYAFRYIKARGYGGLLEVGELTCPRIEKSLIQNALVFLALVPAPQVGDTHSGGDISRSGYSCTEGKWLQRRKEIRLYELCFRRPFDLVELRRRVSNDFAIIRGKCRRVLTSNANQECRTKYKPLHPSLPGKGF